ncbi:hypothetical protein [Deinococcus multiflagellatus]|uniref:Uncharacterized protein n=1 Tax=Deinococcus multiflagellatus TaxID=1656887 RepID=A0ABW1ZN85_9DEIO|nr:hypothetical protein [Deinococcus multiflagellatus]MBZ9715994.1 hypothetical protein [Deinococcus multiflagellatus]
MPLDEYRSPSPARLRLYLGLWLMVLLTAVLGRRSGDLGTRQTLRRSSFARVMFMDIGALSTLGALYLALTGRTAARLPGAAASLVLGSFTLLPALAYEDWVALRQQRAAPRHPDTLD